MKGFYIANKQKKNTASGVGARAKALTKKLREVEKSQRKNKVRRSPSEGTAMYQLARQDLLKGVPKSIKNMTPSSNSSFGKALQNPFAESSFGVRVPDTFSFPTATHHLRSVNTFTATSGGVAGAYFLPNPLLTMVDSVPFYTSSPATTSVALGNGMPRYPGSNIAQYSWSVYGATTITSLVRTYSSYRVVAAGIKITNLLTPLNATGKLYYAQVPIADTIPAYQNMIGYPPDTNFSIDCIGTPASGLSGNVFVNLPTAVEMGATEIIGSEIELCHQIIHPSFYEFKSTAAYGTLNSYVVGDESVIGSLNTIGSVGYKDTTRSNGACAIMIWGEGLPANTPCFAVEHIMHLEGTPILAISQGSIVPSSLPVVQNGSTALVEAAICALSKHAFKVVTGVDVSRAFGNH